MKAETFSTLRPTFKDKFSSVIFDKQTDQMSSEDDKTWLQERSRIFAEHGFQKTDGRFSLMVGSYVLNLSSGLDRATTTADR